MAITTFSSRRFNQDASRAKNAARNGPVVITDRGRPAHVLLSIEEYCRIAERKNILEMLAVPGVVEIDARPACLSADLRLMLGQS